MYYDISRCHIEKGFITHTDAAALHFQIVGTVALVDGDPAVAADWAARINAVPMTDAQILAHENAQNNERIWATIAEIERASLMPRPLRDLIIRSGHEAAAKALEVEGEIAALKAQLQ